MYRKVLLPLDGTKESEKVVQLIQAEMAPEAEVILLRILRHASTQAIGDHVILGSQREDQERLEKLGYLRRLAAQHGDEQRWSCETAISGSPSEGILRFAQKEGVDVIAMCAKERRGLARLLRGSVARAVQKESPIDVRVFTPEGSTDAPYQEAQLGVDLFGELSAKQVNRATALGSRLSVAAGETLGKGGELGQKLYSIVEGEAQSSAHSQLGEFPVRVVGPGESFPIAALLESRTLITSGVALTDMDVVAIPASSLIELCSDDPEIGMRLYKLAAQLFADRYSSTLTRLSGVAEGLIEDPERNWLAPH